MPITTVTLENTAASAQANVPVTFGQVFAKGHLPVAGAAIELIAPNGAIIPCQLDIKATHADGSVRHGIISAIIPSIGASASVVYGIGKAASAPAGAAAVPADFPGLNAVATITDTGTEAAGPNAGTVYTADAAAYLAGGSYRIWLSGPIVSAWVVRVPLVSAAGVEHPDQHARFEIVAYKGQTRARIRYIIENNWAKPKAVASASTPWESVSVAPCIYAYSLKAGNTVVDQRSINGYHRARLTGAANTFSGSATKLLNDATVYTATITVDGVAKPISLTGSAVQTYGQLYAAITAQLGGKGTCAIDEGNLGLRITSATKGAGSSVVISPGTLFPALGYPTAYRPIRGDEHIHYAGQRWTKTFWWGSAPSLHIRHDKTYLIASMAVPNYAPELVGDAAQIAKDLAALDANGDLGQNGITKANMPGPGGAPGIGILPEWQAMYMVNQGRDAKEIMLRMADLMGSWPCHRRDYDTDHPLNFEHWPYATFSPNANDSKNPVTGINEKLPSTTTPAWIPGCPNTADVAHHPDFNFLPYLVTGDHFYMEGLLFYTTFTGLSHNAHATYRDGAKVLYRRDQTRGQAWALRTLAHNRYLLPDNHPNRPSLEYIAASNIEWYNANYVDPAGPRRSMFAHFGELIYTVQGAAKTGSGIFQEDFATQSIGRNVELGFTEFLPLLEYRSMGVKGRLTSGAEYCWQMATAYNIRYKETENSPEYTSWGQAYQKTMDQAVLAAQCGTVEMGAAIGDGLNAMRGYPDGTEGYPANLQPAVAYCATFGMPSGSDAWTVFDARAKKPNYNTGPQFAIVPRATISAEIPETPPTQDTTIMAIADRVKDFTSTTGPGAITLAGTPPKNFQVFLTDPIQIGDRVPYEITHETLAEWENGFGILIDALTLTRDEVTASSNDGQLVNFSAGSKEVVCGLTAAFVEELAGKHNATVSVLSSTPSDTLLLMEIDGVLQKIALPDAGQTFVQMPVISGAAISTAEFQMAATGVDGRATFTAVAAAVKAYIDALGPTDTSAPQFLTGQVSNATPTIILLTFNETLGPYNPGAAAFAVSGGKTVTAVARNGASFSLTVNSAYVYGDVISVTYTKPATNPIQDAIGNQTNSFGPTGVVNNIAAPGDTVVPTISAAAVANASPTIVTLTASEPLDPAFVPAASAFTVSGHTVSAVAISGSTISLTVSAAFVNGEAARTAAYTQPGTNNVRDLAGNLLENFTGKAITNNVAAVATAPGAPTIGTAVAGDGYVDVAYTAPASNGGSAILDYTATLSTGETATGTANPLRVTAANGTARTATIKARNAVGSSAASAASNSVTPAAVATQAYTITPYTGSQQVLPGPIDLSVSANRSTSSAGSWGLNASKTLTSIYYNVVTNPGGVKATSARMGWSNSNTVPPADVITVAQNNASGDANKNGMMPMNATGANSFGEPGGYLWIPKGSGSLNWYLWVQGENGVAQCMNASAPLVTTNA